MNKSALNLLNAAKFGNIQRHIASKTCRCLFTKMGNMEVTHKRLNTSQDNLENNGSLHTLF